jgi:opacity protein-like surface antigen
MKPFLRAAAGIGITLILMGITSFAQVRRVGFSLQAGGAGHEENNLNVGLATGCALTAPLTSHVSLIAEVDYWRTGSRTSFRKLYTGRLFLTPFLLGLRYDFGGNGYFAPYAVAGAGYIQSKFRIDSILSPPDMTIKQDVRSGIAAFLGFGALWKLSAYWDFFTEINYLIRTAPAETIVREEGQNVSTDDIWVNLHVVYWKFGVRFLF